MIYSLFLCNYVFFGRKDWGWGANWFQNSALKKVKQLSLAFNILVWWQISKGGNKRKLFPNVFQLGFRLHWESLTFQCTQMPPHPHPNPVWRMPAGEVRESPAVQGCQLCGDSAPRSVGISSQTVGGPSQLDPHMLGGMWMLAKVTSIRGLKKKIEDPQPACAPFPKVTLPRAEQQWAVPGGRRGLLPTKTSP